MARGCRVGCTRPDPRWSSARVSSGHFCAGQVSAQWVRRGLSSTESRQADRFVQFEFGLIQAFHSIQHFTHTSHQNITRYVVQPCRYVEI
eukprot:2432897-Prymnesium_polylepis.1